MNSVKDKILNKIYHRGRGWAFETFLFSRSTPRKKKFYNFGDM